VTTAFPLAWPEGWPRARSRKRAKFSTMKNAPVTNGGWRPKQDLTVKDATDRVLSELSTFGVPYGESVISTNLALRLDGLPRSDQRAPNDPGVAVYWRRPGESMKVMAIDIYDRVADNLAAVAATLNAMRAIERHGGAQILDRAFTGFSALPPPKNWRDILGVTGPATEELVTAAFRRKAIAAHPDMPGGSHDKMSELNTARDAALKELGA